MAKEIVEDLVAYRDKVYKFIESTKFKSIMEESTTQYFMQNYYDDFIKYCLGGKCVRAFLVLLGYSLCGGSEKFDKILLASVAFEVFEASILAHDDIIDNGRIRRGIPSMFVALGDGELGKARALVLGDVGILVSEKFIRQAGFETQTTNKAIDFLHKIYQSTYSGELIDINLPTMENYTEENVVEMYKLKTAWYTIKGPLVLGGILAGASEKQLKFLGEYGELLGIAFQIKDDILGVFGDSKKMGKPITSDASEGKKSLLTSYFDTHSTPKDKKKFYKVYGKNSITEKQLDAIVKPLLQKSGAYEYASCKMNSIFNEILSLVKEFSENEKQRNMLMDFASFVMSREK